MGYYDSIADKAFTQQDGTYYVRPNGIFSRRRAFDNQSSYEDARSYYIRLNRWLVPATVPAGMIGVKFGWAAAPVMIPAAIAFIAYWYLVGIPRITRNTTKAP